ncbi:hypothetical protein KGP26_00755 [Serratia sp. JSRIV002]|nr:MULTISPECIES: hypothetical protein [unclassified Serratia (in: enterobacteria)]UAN51659.1 hypothetical protein KGP26_00755 [Serratia sp. JSRIV002]UAN57664.1 hypothetical protein KGP21_00755 [Serratia sp. JSRIV004]
MTDKHLTQLPVEKFFTFASDDYDMRVECRFEHKTLWLLQATIAKRYQALLKPTLTTSLHAPLPTSKIIWGHNRGHQPKSNTIKLCKFNSDSYQMRLL